MKKWLALLLAVAMMLTLVACGGTTTDKSSESSVVEESSEESSVVEESSEEEPEEELGRFDALRTTDEELKLNIWWYNFTPTVNEEPTEEAPKVRNACRYATETWLADKPNVTIEWANTYTHGDSEYMTVQYTAHTGPDTFSYWDWGKEWIERIGVYLDEIMASPNYYEPGSPAWIDMYPTYLFDGTVKGPMSDDGRIIAVPQVLDPGCATAYYYNRDLAAELGLEDPTPFSWGGLKENLLIAKEAGVTPDVPYNNLGGLSTAGAAWDSQFSLESPFLYQTIADNDIDGDGKSTMAETFYKNWHEGYWYLGNNEIVLNYWLEYFWKIQNGGYDEGVEYIDYTQPWAEGKVLYMEDGLWAIANYMSNTELTFEVGMFPAPVITPEDNEYVSYLVESTEAGPYNPTLSVAINIADPLKQDRSEYVLDYVIDWMKFMTNNENMSAQIEEEGGALGATKGCAVPASLAEWVTNQFPILKGGYYRLRPNLTEAGGTTFGALCDEFAFGLIDVDGFVKGYDEIMYNCMVDYLQIPENAETIASWEEQFGWTVADWDDCVKPPHMQ